MLKLEINFTFHINKQHEQTMFFNIRNKLCQEDIFTKCLEVDETIDVQFRQAMAQEAHHTSFRKIGVTNVDTKKKSKIHLLMDEKKLILKKKK